MQFVNTLTGKKEKIDISKQLKMYICGVTPYDDAHIGHGRCYVAFDVLNRLLRFAGGQVYYCRNFTDIDDKTIRRAEKEFGDRLRYLEIADRYIKNFHRDMKALNCLSPDSEPRVTDNIDQIIIYIQKLIDKGFAYQSGGDVYFCVESFPNYGKLSKQKIDDLQVGARVNPREQKRNPADFALWKGELEGEFWPSPWGYGRPGWHIECSVLAYNYLGERIDIHGGGLDLIFPHHENEIAQSESLFGEPFARLWMHNGMVNSGKEKMSKSLGNFFTLEDIFKYFDPMVVRYYLLSHHYRMPIEFSFDGLRSAQKSYERLINLCADVSFDEKDNMDYYSSIADRMMSFLYDDLNSPGLLGVLFENITEIIGKSPELAIIKNILVNILGLTLQPLSVQKVVLTPEIVSLINERNIARQEKNWIHADQLRNRLKELGFEVRDDKV